MHYVDGALHGHLTAQKLKDFGHDQCLQVSQRCFDEEKTHRRNQQAHYAVRDVVRYSKQIVEV
jgi:hypothetical protein